MWSKIYVTGLWGFNPTPPKVSPTVLGVISGGASSSLKQVVCGDDIANVDGESVYQSTRQPAMTDRRRINGPSEGTTPPVFTGAARAKPTPARAPDSLRKICICS